MGNPEEPFEFHSTLDTLEQGLEVVHASVDKLREAIGRSTNDLGLVRFETALGEIGANVLTHGRPGGGERVEYGLRFERGTAVASFSDGGPPAHDELNRAMPEHSSEAGRGIALALLLLDELGYERVGDENRWRLVKKL